MIENNNGIESMIDWFQRATERIQKSDDLHATIPQERREATRAVENCVDSSMWILTLEESMMRCNNDEVRQDITGRMAARYSVLRHQVGYVMQMFNQPFDKSGLNSTLEIIDKYVKSLVNKGIYANDGCDVRRALIVGSKASKFSPTKENGGISISDSL